MATTTSVTTAGGVVVVTHVIPNNDSPLPLEKPAVETPQAPPPAAVTPPPPPTKVDALTAMFLRGEPKNLGVVQILVGLLCVLFSLTSAFFSSLLVYAAFSLAVSFVVSGSIGVAAGRQTSPNRVWACLLSHLLSALLALASLVFLCWLMAVDQPSHVSCDPREFQAFQDWERLWGICADRTRLLAVTLYGILIFFLVLMVLQFCVSVTICVFSGMSLRLKGLYSPVQTATEDRRSLLSST